MANSRVAAPKHRICSTPSILVLAYVSSTWGKAVMAGKQKFLRWYELMSSDRRGGKGVLYQSGWVENAGHAHARHDLHAAPATGDTQVGGID